MPRIERKFELDVPPERAIAAAESAVAELAWYRRRDGAILRVREDPAGLCCSMAPVEAELSFAGGPERTEVSVSVYVPGFGPGPRRQLADRAVGLEQRTRRWSRQPEASPAGVTRS